MYRKILVPLDGSELAECVVPGACRAFSAVGSKCNRGETPPRPCKREASRGSSGRREP